jgi:hypothetical protein
MSDMPSPLTYATTSRSGAPTTPIVTVAV